MPPHRRLLAASSAASLKLSQQRDSPEDIRQKWFASPKKLWRIVAPALATPECPEMYDGWFGVVRNGVQSASPAGTSFPSASSARMAVTGRQKSYSYLASQMPITESAIEVEIRANSRAFSIGERLAPSAMPRPA